MNSLVSIIIPHFDRVALLGQTLESLLAQSHQTWEAIVVDDGSAATVQNELVSLMMSDRRFRLLRPQSEVRGPSARRNDGLAAATGEFTLFLDSDDVLAPWCLERRLAAIKRDPATDFVVFGAMIFHSQPGDLNLQWNQMDDPRGDLARFVSATPPWCVSSSLWRTTSLKKIHGFNARLRYGEDAELHTRALLAGFHYTKHSEDAPDIFVRRDPTPRFSTTVSEQLLQAKRTYLSEGTKLLRSSSDVATAAEWERRYFDELEYLIYSVQGNPAAVNALLGDWISDYSPSYLTRWLLRFYVITGRMTQQRAYLILRIVRRLVIFFLPTQMRPGAPDAFGNRGLSADRYGALRNRLDSAAQGAGGTFTARELPLAELP